MKKAFSLLLVCVMILCCGSGCGGTATTSGITGDGTGNVIMTYITMLTEPADMELVEEARRSILNDFLDTQIQKKVFKTVHGGNPVNSFAPWHESQRQTDSKGQLYVNDLCYGSTYPNSFFDIRYPHADTTTRRPTLIYFHGGGFLFGDKSDGDPPAVGENGVSAMLSAICNRGYNVVSANYAFATEYHFPVQLHQVNHLMAHLQDHKEYGLDMDRIVLMGGSAGADLVAIYGMMVTDEEYARKIGIKPCLTGAQLKALVVDEMILNASHMSRGLKMLLSAWVGERNMDLGTNSQLIHIASHFNGKFPPCIFYRQQYRTAL